MVAEPDIDREMHAVGTDALLVAMAELQELRALVRLRDLAAAVVGHVAADDEAERPWRSAGRRREAGRRAVDLAGQRLPAEPVQCRDMAKQVGVGLAFRRAIGAEPARHAAGMDVGCEDEGGVDRGVACRTAGGSAKHGVTARCQHALQQGAAVEQA